MASTAFRIEVIKNHLAGVRLSQNLTSASGNYEYTLNGKKLTTFQRDFYERNGYLLIKNLVPHEILDQCRDHFLDICEGKFDKGQMILMKEILHMGSTLKGEFLYNKVQDILHDEVFSLYTEYPELLDYVECFTGSNIMGMHSMLINKPPGTSIHPPHQDLHYFPFRPANKIVASWTAMEPVYVENGCLYVVPGTHKGQLYSHEYPPVKEGVIVNKAYHGIQNYDQVAPEDKRVYLSMEKGDTVFFHPRLIHGSGINSTQNCRKAISCHYAAGECDYIDTDGTTQENIAKEVEAMSRRRGMDSDFKNIWFIRGKNVRGIRLTL